MASTGASNSASDDPVSKLFPPTDDVSLLSCSGDQVSTVHSETPMRLNVELEFWKCPTCGREITPKMLRDSIGKMPWEAP